MIDERKLMLLPFGWETLMEDLEEVLCEGPSLADHKVSGSSQVTLDKNPSHDRTNLSYVRSQERNLPLVDDLRFDDFFFKCFTSNSKPECS